MKNRKAISGLIETVLLILVVIAAAGILVGVLIPMIRGPVEKAQICVDAMEITSVSTASGTLTITLKKDVSLAGVAINMYNAAGNVNSTSQSVSGMSIGEAKSFNLPTGISSPTKVTVVPKLMIKGKMETCPAIEYNI